MASRDYTTFVLHLDTDYTANGSNKVQLVPPGRTITGVRCGNVVPATTPFRVHLGLSADPIDFYQGDAFVDDGDGSYTDGLFYSQTSAPPAGATANLTVFF